jgi:hypothetical protein
LGYTVGYVLSFGVEFLPVMEEITKMDDKQIALLGNLLDLFE